MVTVVTVVTLVTMVTVVTVVHSSPFSGRLVCCPDKLVFMRTLMNWVDLVTIIPYFIQVSSNTHKCTIYNWVVICQSIGLTGCDREGQWNAITPLSSRRRKLPTILLELVF